MTDTTPLISVVMATYNRNSALRGLLEALNRQSLSPEHFEVVICDDGSEPPASTATLNFVSDYKLQLLRQNNSGAAAARHNAISHANGDIIVIIDDDMEVDSDFLSQHLRAHEMGADVVVGQIKAPRGQRKLPLYERFHIKQHENLSISARSGKPIHGSALSTGNVSFKRDLYLKVGGFDPVFKQGEDMELGHRFEKAGAKIGFSSDAASYHNSDHYHVSRWINRSFNYGIWESTISQKHPDLPLADPWRYIYLVHPLSRPLFLSAVLMPRLSAVLAKLIMRASFAVDKMGLEGFALKGTTVVFGLQVFRGMREDAGSASESLHRFLTYRTKRKASL
jgi:GT2 family glycosyltransferase